MTLLINYLDQTSLDLIPDKQIFNDIIIDKNNPIIDLDNIADKLGCTVIHKYSWDYYENYNSQTKEITVNLREPHEQQRMNLAVGLIKYLLNYEQPTDDLDAILIGRKISRLALKLVIPDKLLEHHINKLKYQTDFVHKLAKTFMVLDYVMDKRLEDYGDNLDVVITLLANKHNVLDLVIKDICKTVIKNFKEVDDETLIQLLS